MKLFFGCLLLLVHLALWWWGRRRGWLRGRGCRCPGRQVSKIGWVLVLGQARPRCGQALCGETKKGKMAQLGAVVQFEGYLCKLSISKAGWGGVWKETWGSKWKEGGGGGRVRAGSSISRPSEVWRFHLVLVETMIRTGVVIEMLKFWIFGFSRQQMSHVVILISSQSELGQRHFDTFCFGTKSWPGCRSNQDALPVCRAPRHCFESFWILPQFNCLWQSERINNSVAISWDHKPQIGVQLAKTNINDQDFHQNCHCDHHHGRFHKRARGV